VAAGTGIFAYSPDGPSLPERLAGRYLDTSPILVGRSGQISCSSATQYVVEKRAVVDALLHLEASLWRSHSIRRALVQLRNEAPPPPVQVPERAIATLTNHMDEMRQECAMLEGIIGDLTVSIRRLSDELLRSPHAGMRQDATYKT
jgi:hypothetical protein